ncbi:unnamed protein product, partial [Bubo scandiacus]
NPTGHSLRKHALADPASARELDWMISLPMFHAAEECLHVKIFSFSHSVPHSEYTGDGEEGGRGTLVSPDLNLLKGYSIRYDITLSNKGSRKGEGNRDI